MKHAIIEVSGKQFKVQENEKITIQSLLGKKGETITFDKIIAVIEDGKTEIGTPYLTGIKVKGQIIDAGKGEKIEIAKFKSKVRFRRKKGFRPNQTIVLIEKIGEESSVKVEKEVKTPVSRKRPAKKMA